MDRLEVQSVVARGPWAGRTLREIMSAHAADVMGPAWPKGRPFPILVKWLDCRERLSLQVHPPASIAAKFGGEPKTENWYIARAEPGAAVLAGLKPGVDAAAFRVALENNTAEALVHRLPTAAGDSLLIHSGVMHAIDAGNVILEIQQNSDTTYRVYDWGRTGLDGKGRTLHVRESLESVAANTAPAPQFVRSGAAPQVLAHCREFTIRRVPLAAGGRLEFAARQQPRIVSVVEGALEAGTALGRGDSVLLPHADGFVFTAKTPAIVLITENFCHAQ